MIKKTILTIIGLAAAVLLFYAAFYTYFVLQFMFTWQCQIYDGHDFNQEQVRICENYNSGGLYKVLTN